MKGFVLFVLAVLTLLAIDFTIRRAAHSDAVLSGAVASRVPAERAKATMPTHLDLNGKEWKVTQTPDGEEYFSLSVSCDTRVIEVNTNKPNARGNLLQGVEVSSGCGDKKFRYEDVYSTSLDAWSLAEILQRNPSLAAYLGEL